KTEQDVLLDLAAHPLVIHDEQIGPGTVSLRTNEQIGAPVSPSWITRRRNTITDCDYFEIRRDTRISRWQASGCLESTGCGQLASPTVEDECGASTILVPGHRAMGGDGGGPWD